MLIIVGSVREGRRGEPVARWFADIASARDDLTCEVADLKELALPLLIAPKSPSSGEYGPEQTRWAERVAGADGYVLVTPEYNHGYPPALKNALDLVYAEWNRKPMGCVSYGGASGGVRAVQQLRQVAVELQMAPVRANVAIPRVFRRIGDDGRFDGEEFADSAAGLLDELVWWSRALASARG